MNIGVNNSWNYLWIFCRYMVYQATHWLRSWSPLLPMVAKKSMESGCSRMETVAQEFNSRSGWGVRRSWNGQWMIFSLLWFLSCTWDVTENVETLFLLNNNMVVCIDWCRGRGYILLFSESTFDGNFHFSKWIAGCIIQLRASQTSWFLKFKVN